MRKRLPVPTLAETSGAEAGGGAFSGQVVKEKRPGRYRDGDGLQFYIKATGAAVWVFRYSIGGARRDMGLGNARGKAALSLAEARTKAGDSAA